MIYSAVNRFRAILASFLNQNPNISPGLVLGGKVNQIKDIDVLLTLVAGKPVYVSSSFQAQVAPLGN